MTSSITPEVVGIDNTELLLDTDLTPTELARVESLETKLRMSDATVLEQKIIQGETLFRIQQERLYRSREPGERFTWEQYLQKFTPALTKNGKGYGVEAAQLRQMLHLFHSGQISPRSNLGRIPLPTETSQLVALLGKAPIRGSSAGGGFDLNGDWTAVLEIWKAANSKTLNPGRHEVAAARSTYETNQLRAGADPGRMMSKARQESLNRANEARMQNSIRAGVAESVRTPTPDYSPTPSPQPSAPAAPSIPAWEIQTDDSSVDAGAECKRITQALNDAHKAIGTLRGILYSQTQRYGSDYLGFLRQVDAGVYSLNSIDDQVQQMSEDIQRIMDVLASQAEPGELAQSTVDVDSMPSRA
jgi:hypothetical protein